MCYAASGPHFFILGGQDLNKGVYNSLWRLNLQTVRDNVRQAQWEELYTRGEIPYGISHGCMFIYENKLFLFDINCEENAKKRYYKKADESKDLSKPVLFHVLNLINFTWQSWRYEKVPQIEDFAHCFDCESGTLWLFGGYHNGSKSNILIKIDVNLQTR